MEPIIYDGEHIFVKNTSTLEYGEIGIFYINGEVTCKKYHPTDECIYLESLNPDFQPFKYDFKNECDFKIQGRVLLTSEQKARIK
jgi:SOS-response transcriptional repressor LexA